MYGNKEAFSVRISTFWRMDTKQVMHLDYIGVIP